MPKTKTTNSVIPKIEKKLKQVFPKNRFEVNCQAIDNISSIAISWSGELDQCELLESLDEFDISIAFWINNKQYLIVKLPYDLAIVQPPKTGSFIPITPVSWNKNAESQLETITFETIPSRQIAIPRNLPKGYQMITHPIYQSIEDELTNPNKIATASFDEIDAIIRDIEVYEKKLDILLERSIERDEYWEYKEDIEKTWDKLDQIIIDVHRRIEKRIEATYPQLVRKQNAPRIEEYLVNSLGIEATQVFLKLAQALKIDVN